MNNVKFIIALSLSMTLLSSNLSAQLTRTTTKVGSTVAQFLKIGAGSRAVAMGGSGVAMDGDIYASYWNPGSLSRMKTNGEVSFNHVKWLADMSYDFAAAALTIDGFGTIGAQLTSFSVPEDIVRTEINPDGDGRRWDAGSFALGVSFSRALTDRFSIGMTAKYIREAIWNMSAQGFALDIGTIYTTQFNDLKIGASISNFGSKLRLDGHDVSFNTNPGGISGQGPQNVQSLYKTEAYDIPLLFRLGLSMDAVKIDNMRATVAVDATHPNDNTEYINSGLELAYDEMFFGRIGYKSFLMQDSEEGMTWGIGVNVGINNTTGIKLDYAFADFGRLKNVQYLTLSVTY
jgi:hypothetical protein